MNAVRKRVVANYILVPQLMQALIAQPMGIIVIYMVTMIIHAISGARHILIHVLLQVVNWVRLSVELSNMLYCSGPVKHLSLRGHLYKK